MCVWTCVNTSSEINLRHKPVRHQTSHQTALLSPETINMEKDDDNKLRIMDRRMHGN